MRIWRRLAKLGVVLCGLILAVGVASMFVGFGFGDTHCIVSGCVSVYSEPVEFARWRAWEITPDYPMSDRLGAAFSLPWGATGCGFDTSSYSEWPLWIPFMVVAVSTALLWRVSPYPTGHCQRCGYDLTGNVTGRCPECGIRGKADQPRRAS